MVSCLYVSVHPCREWSDPSHRVRSRRRASLRGDRFVELSAHKPLGRQPCCVAMSPGALVFHGASRERESLPGADTMLLFVPGIVSAILVSDFRSPHTWLPTASMATAVRTNGLFSS